MLGRAGYDSKRIWTGMKKGKKQGLEKSRPPRKRSTGKAASLVSFAMHESGKGQAAPQNGRKPYQFQPGNEYRWRPGESGNPAGRARGNARQIAEEFGCQRHAKTDKTRDEHAFEVLYRRLCQGDMQAGKLWLAYRFGNPVTPLEHGGSIDLRSVLAEARKRAESHRAEQALLPAEAPTNGTNDAWTARAAADTAEKDSAREDAEQPVKPKIRVEPWAN